MESLEITKYELEQALFISEDDSFQIKIKRASNSCFVINYFIGGLLVWEANIDSQLVFNLHKAVTYMFAYLSKTEVECSHAMNEGLRNVFGRELDNYEQMKPLAYSYLRKRECSVLESVYHFLLAQ